ncbi:MAG: sugar phosphate isomerase/epimerase family protein [Deinococcales bacterium]
MIKVGVHGFVFVGGWTTQSGNDAIEQAGQHGFDVIEMPLLNPQTFDAKSHKKALMEAGIEGTTSLALPKDCHMPKYPDKAKAFLMAALDKVEEVGSQYLGGCTAYNLGTLTGQPPTEAERATVVEVLGEVVAEAKKRGIRVALEACNRYETYLYNTLEDARATIQTIGSDNLKLHADTYHMNIEEEGFYKPIIKTADVLNYIHMSESHRGLVGSGTVNWAEVWKALQEINFKGYLVLESFSAINPDLMAATCLWRPPNQSSEVLARAGHKFLREGVSQYLSS